MQPIIFPICSGLKESRHPHPGVYTEYPPLPTNSWYNSWISPWQPQIATNLQNCSSAGLYFKMTTNGDISSAMQALFEQAVATARLRSMVRK